ncbi:MAG: GTPase HflX [Bacteroidetes bacterium]|nr:MAG: GTPase HflX [Bacteroidota bacterium]
MIENKVFSRDKEWRGVLVGVEIKGQRIPLQEYLDELKFLASTYNVTTIKTFIQKLEKPDPATFIGKGKAEEIKNFIDNNQVDVVIFDDELSPVQQRNLEKLFQKRVMDRTMLILEIFVQRAKTSYAKAQVQLAQYEYLLPRLTGMWTHLERQRGGTGTRGGAGEKEIETDRRIIKNKIAQLKKELREIDKQMLVQRKNRSQLVRVTLVGYTNVGKSTLMNLLSKSKVFVENKLFATLDTTTRKVILDTTPFLLSDTVGFIRKLPHQLIESFKSTLDEAREADILLHVVDVSHPSFEEHIKVVNETLREIGAGNKTMIVVFNKIDLYLSQYQEFLKTHSLIEDDQMLSIEELKKTWMNQLHHDVVFISAEQKINIQELRELIKNKVESIYHQRYPYVSSFLQLK